MHRTFSLKAPVFDIALHSGYYAKISDSIEKNIFVKRYNFLRYVKNIRHCMHESIMENFPADSTIVAVTHYNSFHKTQSRRIFFSKVVNSVPPAAGFSVEVGQRPINLTETFCSMAAGNNVTIFFTDTNHLFKTQCLTDDILAIIVCKAEQILNAMSLTVIRGYTENYKTLRPKFSMISIIFYKPSNFKAVGSKCEL